MVLGGLHAALFLGCCKTITCCFHTSIFAIIKLFLGDLLKKRLSPDPYFNTQAWVSTWSDRKRISIFSTMLDYSFKRMKGIIIHLNEWHDRKTTEKGREKCGEWKRREGQTEKVRQMRRQQVRGQRRASLCVDVCVYWGGVWSETFGLWTSLPNRVSD